MMTFWSYVFGWISAIGILVNPIDAASLHLSESGSDGNGSNNCQQGSSPCGTWDHASSLLNSHYNSLNISSGFYDAKDEIELSDSSDITVFGEYASNTVIYYTNNYGTLFFGSEDYYATDNNTSLHLGNITYFPKYGSNQRLVYFHYGNSLEMINIIVNGSGSLIGSYYSVGQDLVYCFELDDIIVHNVEIFDMTCTTSNAYCLNYMMMNQLHFIICW